MNKVFSSIQTSVGLISRTMASYKNVTHCIFDMDGLLLDTETLYTKATQSILDPFDKTYTWEFKETIMGLAREVVGTKIIEHYDLPISLDEYLEKMNEQIALLMPDCVLLPDTEKTYEKVIHEIAESYNKKYPWDTRMKLLGTTERRSCEIAVNDMKLPCTVDEFQKQFREMCHVRLTDVPMMPGAERLIRHLKSHNIPICVATSSGADSVAIKTKNHRAVFDLFHHIVCGSTDPEVKEGKPAPYIFLIAAQRYDDKPKPDFCLVFEDAPNGVKAANAAGMQVVMVPDKNVAEEMRQNATLVINSLEEFQPELFGLPPFEK